ncbi:RNA polymerase sigma factor [Caulobacter soli]|uniref:RNA polymerase sigma factor n=1 Tax=Caulobacter soli TaxID=2708539 RepID=UPI0013EC42EE|nr:RNA polymerase sigma factor [Caulobacter soli]
MFATPDGALVFPDERANVLSMSDGDPHSKSTHAVSRQFRDARWKLLGWIRRRVPDPVEAEDLLQDTFLRVTQREASDEVAHFEGYLYRTAESVLADRYRRRSVRRADSHIALEPDDHQAEDADALRALLAREKLRAVSASLMQLPERTRAVFVLRRIEGLRYGEIATRLKVSLSTVEKDMARAIDHLMPEEDEA